MKYIGLVFALISIFLPPPIYAQGEGGKNFGVFVRDDLGISPDQVRALQSHSTISSIFSEADKSFSTSENESSETGNPLTDYEPPLPNASKPKIPHWEAVVLAAYLDNVNDSLLAQFLAIYHLKKSLLDRNNHLTGNEL